MTQEDKKIILKDLYSRLLYGFKIHRFSDNVDIVINSIDEFSHFLDCSEDDDFKPYLRPMSSMTKEERHELCNIRPCYINSDDIVNGTQCNNFIQASECQDWLNAHHFDYRGLIEKGLALEAPEGMYNHYDEEFNDGWRNWSPRDLT